MHGQYFLSIIPPLTHVVIRHAIPWIWYLKIVKHIKHSWKRCYILSKKQTFLQVFGILWVNKLGENDYKLKRIKMSLLENLSHSRNWMPLYIFCPFQSPQQSSMFHLFNAHLLLGFYVFFCLHQTLGKSPPVEANGTTLWIQYN